MKFLSQFYHEKDVGQQILSFLGFIHKINTDVCQLLGMIENLEYMPAQYCLV